MLYKPYLDQLYSEEQKRRLQIKDKQLSN
jgi:hypothetical protein